MQGCSYGFFGGSARAVSLERISGLSSVNSRWTILYALLAVAVQTSPSRHSMDFQRIRIRDNNCITRFNNYSYGRGLCTTVHSNSLLLSTNVVKGFLNQFCTCQGMKGLAPQLSWDNCEIFGDVWVRIWKNGVRGSESRPDLDPPVRERCQPGGILRGPCQPQLMESQYFQRVTLSTPSSNPDLSWICLWAYLSGSLLNTKRHSVMGHQKFFRIAI